MARPLRPRSEDVVSHVPNQANVRRTLFENDGDSPVCERTMLPDTLFCSREPNWPDGAEIRILFERVP